MAKSQAVGRISHGIIRGRDSEFPYEPNPVSGQKMLREGHLMSPPHRTTAVRVTLDRPSTSGGFSTRRAAQKLKQETRDDLHFVPHSGPEVSTTYYNFPLPASLPTPVATPRSSPPRAASPVLLDLGVTESNAAPMQIGMALGSPSHQPVSWQLEPHHYYGGARQIESPESMDQVEDWKQAAMQPKPKASRWKRLFGGKRKTMLPTAFYQVQPEPTDVKHRYMTFPSPPPSVEQPQTGGGEERPRTRSRTNTVSEKNAKQAPQTKQSLTAPPNFESLAIQQEPKATEVEQIKSPEIQLDGGPLLNVDIPRIEMERYSIMFGSVLTQPGTQPSSSLLARRQATLDKLKLVNDAIAEHERNERSRLLRTRRATSPITSTIQTAKSPAFSLFPAPPSSSRARPSPSSSSNSPLVARSARAGSLQRSNTSPAALSPIRQTFTLQPAPVTAHHAHSLQVSKNLEVSTSSTSVDTDDLEHPGEIHTIMLALTPSPTLPTPAPRPSPIWSADKSHLHLDSPNSFVSSPGEIEIPVPPMAKPSLREPTWEMVPPGASTTIIPAITTKILNGALPAAPVPSAHEEPRKRRARSNTTKSIPQHGSDDARLASPAALNPSKAKRSPTASRGGTRSPENSLQERDVSNAGARLRNVNNENETMAAAEASIARQISVSRQQRNLLLPVSPRGGGMGGDAIDDVGMGSVSGSSTPVSAVMKMMPMLVTVGRRVEGRMVVVERT